MTKNDTPDKLEWSIRPRMGTDSAQWDRGIIQKLFLLMFWKIKIILLSNVKLIQKVFSN